MSYLRFKKFYKFSAYNNSFHKMDRIFARRRFDLKSVFSFSDLEKDVQNHLKNVYTTLAIGLLAAALGSYIHMANIFQAGLLTLLGSIGFLLAIMFTEFKRETIPKRIGFFIGFAACTGMGLGPLMEVVIQIDPSILPTAFISTAVIFICFSLSALMTNSRRFLYLGGMLMSGLSMMIFASFINMFVRSVFIMTAELYIGLIIFCGFILFDTQMIVEKCRHGDKDFIWHSLDLFIDFIEIFRHLMVIMANNNSNNKKKRNN